METFGNEIPNFLSLLCSSMESQELTEYERKRIENIRRNDEMVAALKLHSKASELAKRPRLATKSYNVKSEKKPKSETPVAIRRSSRTRGIPPDSKGLVDSNALTHKSLGMASLEAPEQLGGRSKGGRFLEGSSAKRGEKNEGSLNFESLSLDPPEYIARVVPERITEVREYHNASVLAEPMLHSCSAMEPQKLTEYERRRLENIRRNEEMVAALRLHSKAAELTKRPRVGTKSNNVKLEKKPKSKTPVVSRRSLRARGVSPDFKGGLEHSRVTRNVSGDLNRKFPVKVEPFVNTSAPIPMSDAHRDTRSDRSLLESFAGMASKKAHQQLGGNSKGGEYLDGNTVKKGVKNEGSLKLESMSSGPPNYIARVVPERITEVRFCPSSCNTMIVAGNSTGHIGFWNVEESEVYLYRPHLAPISGILVQPHCLPKIYTSCYDGVVRLMDAEKELFDLVFNSNDDECIYALSQPKNDSNCLYFGDGSGGLTVIDSRTGKRSFNWVLHERRINTIDFNCENPHILATGSTDRTACTWDMRYTGGGKLTALKTLTHKKSVQSAYFSPSGCSLATTCLDSTVGIYSGVNLEDATSIYHVNSTDTMCSSFRAIWGSDDSYLFIGSTKRGVDVVSTAQKATVLTLQSGRMPAIPCRLDAHFSEVGMVAGATGGGQVYIWTLF